MFQVFRRKHGAVGDELRRQARQAALAGRVGIIGLLERMNEPAQEIVGVIGDVRRHLRIAEVGCARSVGRRAECAQKMRLPGARLSMEQQNAGLIGATLARRDRPQCFGKFQSRFRVDLAHVNGIRAPDIVFPRDRMLEGVGQLISGPISRCIVHGAIRDQTHTTHTLSALPRTEALIPQCGRNARPYCGQALRTARYRRANLCFSGLRLRAPAHRADALR